MRVVAYIAGKLVVGVELVRVGIGLLGGSEGVDLVGTNFEVLLEDISALSGNLLHHIQAYIRVQFDFILLLLLLGSCW